VAAALFFAALAAASPFATEVLDYTPAPGQFINNPQYNDPSRALGPPAGGGTLAASNAKVVSLGGFGGSITLGFATTVTDDPLTPLGLDAILYGNAFWTGGDPTRRFAEAGTIEISLDVNGNGLPDDPWYLIPGSSLPPTPGDVAASQTWDNDPNTPLPPANIAWYPDPAVYPDVPESYTTTGYLLPPPFQTIPLVNPTTDAEAFFGFADLSPTLLLGDIDADNIIEQPDALPEQFYTRPDNPFLVGISPGSGGGDAFDIAWAVHPATGEPANLPGFDFIRISSGASALGPLFGELSTEVSAVAAVSPDPSFYDIDVNGSLDIEDLYRWHAIPIDLTGEQSIDESDRVAQQRAVRAGEQPDLNGGSP
jgi:hypothetical protein